MTWFDRSQRGAGANRTSLCPSSVAGRAWACPTHLLVLCSRELTVLSLAFGTDTPACKLARPAQHELDRATSPPWTCPSLCRVVQTPERTRDWDRRGGTSRAPPRWDGGLILTNHCLLPARCSALTPQTTISQIYEGQTL